MGSYKTDIRISSKELFIYYHKHLDSEGRDAVVGGCTNKRILASRTGVGYYTLMKVFTRRGDCFYENGDVIIIKLFTSDIIKGKQSMSRRGRGGMEKFLQYTYRERL